MKSIMVAEHNAEARIMSGSFAKGVLVLNSNMLCLLFAAFAALLLCSGSSFLLLLDVDKAPTEITPAL